MYHRAVGVGNLTILKSRDWGLVDGPVWELGAVKGVHLAAPPGYGSRTQKEKLMVNQ